MCSIVTRHGVRPKFVHLASKALAAVLMNGIALAGTVPLSEGSGAFRISQIDLTHPGAERINSQYGQFALDASRFTSLGAGYVNVMDSRGEWVVRNLPIDPYSNGIGAFGGISTQFDLGDPATVGNVTSLGVYVEWSDSPVQNFAGGPTVPVNVGTTLMNMGGMNTVRADPPGHRINLGTIPFLGGPTRLHWQGFRTNIEQDVNQCGTAAIANSLDYLERAYGRQAVTFPDPHFPGVQGNPALVAKIDQHAGRAQGQALNLAGWLNGKTGYIAATPLRNQLVVEGYNIGGTQRINGINVTDATPFNSPAGYEGWLMEKVSMNCDVEIWFDWDNVRPGEVAGHCVNIIGAGMILGRPWIAWINDANQGFTPPTMPNEIGVHINGGINWFDGGVGFSFLDGTSIKNFFGTTRDAAFVRGLSECVPSTGVLAPFAVFCVMASRRRRVPLVREAAVCG